MDHSPYLNCAMTQTQRVIGDALKTLGDHVKEFDAIVVTGVSGLIVGPTLAYLLGKRLAVVRKKSDWHTTGNNHAVVNVESALNMNDRWIFVDDLIASGETIKRVETEMRVVEGFKGKMAGRYLYNSDCWTEGEWYVY